MGKVAERAKVESEKRALMLLDMGSGRREWWWKPLTWCEMRMRIEERKEEGIVALGGCV